MNPWQMLQQLKHELQQVAWPGGSTEVVFGDRGAMVGLPAVTGEDSPSGFPFVLIEPESTTADEDDPDDLETSYSVTVVAAVAGDAIGEFAMIGGSASDLGSSAGRGIEEVVERVRSAIQSLHAGDGASIQLSAASSSAPREFDQGKHVAAQQLSVTARGPSGLYYAAPQELTHSAEANAWTWQGAPCSSRFDFLQFRLVQKDGSSPSTDPSDGTTLYTGTAATTVLPRGSSSTYTVFADYNARGGATVEGSSSPVRGSWVAGI